MANRPSRLNVSIPTASSDGRFYGPWPHGDNPNLQAFLQNQPTGLSVLIDRQWDPTDSLLGTLPPASLTGTDSMGMTWNSGDQGVAPLIASPASLAATLGLTVPAPPDSHPTIMAIRYPNGFPAANVPFALFRPTVPNCARMYHSCYVMMPAAFNSQGNNIKWLNIQADGKANHVFMLCSGGTTDYRAAWLALQGGFGNREIGGSDGTTGAVVALAQPPPQGSGTGWWLSMRGPTWRHLETLFVQETVPGVSGDGQFWSWIDGVLLNKHLGLNYNASSGDSNAFQDCSLIPYFGGGGSNAVGDQTLFVGRWYVSGA